MYINQSCTQLHAKSRLITDFFPVSHASIWWPIKLLSIVHILLLKQLHWKHKDPGNKVCSCPRSWIKQQESLNLCAICLVQCGYFGLIETYSQPYLLSILYISIHACIVLPVEYHVKSRNEHFVRGFHFSEQNQFLHKMVYTYSGFLF